MMMEFYELIHSGNSWWFTWISLYSIIYLKDILLQEWTWFTRWKILWMIYEEDEEFWRWLLWFIKVVLFLFIIEILYTFTGFFESITGYIYNYSQNVVLRNLYISNNYLRYHNFLEDDWKSIFNRLGFSSFYVGYLI